MRYLLLSLYLSVLMLPASLAAETGYDAWLRYAPLTGPARYRYNTLPANVVALGDSIVIKTAQAELIRGVRGMLGRMLRANTELPQEGAVLLGTLDAVKAAVPALSFPTNIKNDGFWIKTVTVKGFPCLSTN